MQRIVWGVCLAILTGCAATQVEKEYSSSVTHSVEKDNSPSVTHNIEEFVISSLHDVYRKKAAVLLGRDVYANELCAAFENESAMAVRVAWIIENAEYSKRMMSDLHYSAEYIEWQTQVVMPKNQDYYEFAKRRIEQLELSRKKENARVIVEILRPAILKVKRDFNIQIVLNGDYFDSYVETCPGLFFGETKIINYINERTESTEQAP